MQMRDAPLSLFVINFFISLIYEIRLAVNYLTLHVFRLVEGESSTSTRRHLLFMRTATRMQVRVSYPSREKMVS